MAQRWANGDGLGVSVERIRKNGNSHEMINMCSVSENGAGIFYWAQKDITEPLRVSIMENSILMTCIVQLLFDPLLQLNFFLDDSVLLDPFLSTRMNPPTQKRLSEWNYLYWKILAGPVVFISTE